MRRLKNTWRLTKVSWSLLKQDRELLLLPIFGLLSIVGIAIVAAVVGLLTGSFEMVDDSFQPAAAVLGLVFAFAAVSTMVFFNGALVAGAHERMTGGDPTVRSAMGKAASRLPSLLGWAFVAMTVGLVIRFLRERLGWLGQILTFLAEAAWDVATYLVVPAIIVDDHGPVASIKQSASLVRRTWGENLASQAGFGLLGIVLAMPVIIAAALIGAVVPGVGAAIAFAILITGLFTVFVVIGALSQYFKTALYEYATDGVAHGGYDMNQMRTSFAAG